MYELIPYALKKYGDKVAVSYYLDDGIIERKTYKELHEDVLRLGSWFYANCLQKKNVGLIAELSYEWIVSFYALSMVGAVPVLIDPNLSKGEIDLVLKQSNSYCVIASGKFVGQDSSLKDLCITLSKRLDANNKNVCFCVNQILRKAAQPSCDFFIPSSDDVAVLALTSGTTGKQKIVMLTHKNLICDLMLSYRLAGQGNDTATVAILPPHHMLELTTGIQTPIYVGCPICICSDKKRIIKSFKDFKPSILILVPSVIQMMRKQVWSQARTKGKSKFLKLLMLVTNFLLTFNIDIRKRAFPFIQESFGGHLKTIISGGAQLAYEVIEEFHVWGIEIYNGYGITECSPVVCCNMPKSSKKGSVGLVAYHPFVDVIIKNDEVYVAGDIVMKGYYHDESSTNSSFSGNYFKTGDLGFIDKDGYLHLVGRKKNLIVLSNGENVSPEVLEEKFSKIDGVEDILVFAKEDNGETVLCAVIRPTETYCHMRNLQKYFEAQFSSVSLQLPLHKRIYQIIIRKEEFIRSGNGKIKRIKENYKA